MPSKTSSSKAATKISTSEKAASKVKKTTKTCRKASAILVDDATSCPHLKVVKGVMSPEALEHYCNLLKGAPFENEKVKMYGKELDLPNRRVVAYRVAHPGGDNDSADSTAYGYSGFTRTHYPTSGEEAGIDGMAVATLTAMAEYHMRKLGFDQRSNTAILTHYREENDESTSTNGLGFHSDRKSKKPTPGDIEPNSIVWSLTLEGQRPIYLKSNDGTQLWRADPAPGDLYFMTRGVQEAFKHCVDPGVGSRKSLTGRRILLRR